MLIIAIITISWKHKKRYILYDGQIFCKRNDHAIDVLILSFSIAFSSYKQKFCSDLLIPLSSSHRPLILTTGSDSSNICASQSEFVQCHMLFFKVSYMQEIMVVATQSPKRLSTTYPNKSH